VLQRSDECELDALASEVLRFGWGVGVGLEPADLGRGHAGWEVDGQLAPTSPVKEYGFALLRCGTPADFDRDPDYRLRVTIGLRKVDDRWTVAHEHHSFADTTGTSDHSEQSAIAVRAVFDDWFERTAAKDLDGLT
jgi:hypothetical protein